jgi:RHS repeat-associated protein
VSRVAAETDPAASTVHFTYDAADRLVGATYPDGTTASLAYTLLDLTSSTDRLRETTTYRYDADRELISATDPLGHTIQQGFNLAGQLDSITDANNHTTTLVLDDQSRLINKQFANGSSVGITYDPSLSLVATVTDALGQTTDYTYNLDNSLAAVSYTANQPTASVSFSYDPAYPRVVSMTDGVGTTTYSYYPVSSPPQLGANQLQSVTSPVAAASTTDTVTYTYDALGRVVGDAINGAAQSIGFDALWRTTSASNPLDSFTYSYADGTARVSEVTSNNGPAAAMTYFGPAGDELLQQMKIATHSGVTSLEQFGYTYNADNNVTSVSLSSPAQLTTYGYDQANRLISGSTPQYAYVYDHASNLTSITPNGPQQTLSYTSTNQITPASYDANGSPTALGGNLYTWDGANRIIGFANSAAHTSSSFTYDGLGRLVRIVDTKNGTLIADHSYFWCGTVRCLAHDNTQSGSPVTKQYFAQGVIASGTPYYYVQDQLASVTQLVSSSGNVAAQYAYDPYGNRTVVTGAVVSDIGYAGYFYHANSGLEFALYRAYDPVHARWLNRDPIGEAGGLNLYAYANGNPISLRDPSGTCPPCVAIYLWLTENAAAIAVAIGIATDVVNDVPNPVSAPVAAAEEGLAGIAAARQLGKQGEAAVCKVADIGPKTRIFINGRSRVPDGLIPDQSLNEVKNVAYQGWTQQLQDYAQYAQDNDLEFNLFVRPGAGLSGPLLDAQSMGLVNIQNIPF